MSEDVNLLRSKIAALEQLLEVFEQTTIGQTQRLQQALRDNEIASRRLLEAERERAEWAVERAQVMEKELEIARRIQISILPRSVDVEGLEIAAHMATANEVGGDYYDVIPVEDGAWLGIGDVSGHGLNAGLVMLMTQSIAASLARCGMASPADMLDAVNSVLFENIRKRLVQKEHVTLTLLRYRRDGSVTFAGAHEDILVCRTDGSYERVETPGTWVGVKPTIRHVTRDSTIQLHDGDIMVLHTDGVTEARNEDRAMFGVDRLAEVLVASLGESPRIIADRILTSLEHWATRRVDDATWVVARYHAS